MLTKTGMFMPQHGQSFVIAITTKANFQKQEALLFFMECAAA